MAPYHAHTGFNLLQCGNPVFFEGQHPLSADLVHVLLTTIDQACRERGGQLYEKPVDNLRHLLRLFALGVLLRQVVRYAASLFPVKIANTLGKIFHSITPSIQSVLCRSMPLRDGFAVPVARSRFVVS